MDIIASTAATIIEQFQKPTLAFLIGGMFIAAIGSRFEIPQPVYKFIVALLLLKVGLGAGISVRNADPADLMLPAVLAAAVGVGIVLLGKATLLRLRGVHPMDGMATAGLFGAVSASSLAAGMAILDEEGIRYEGFIGALYPFMDVAALVTAIVLARVSAQRAETRAVSGGVLAVGGAGPRPTAEIEPGLVRGILIDTVRSPAISALLLGLLIGLLARPETVFDSFYEPLFRGLLSVLMVIMGIEAWQRLSELKGVAHAYLAYGFLAPLVHGALGFGAGLIAHHMVGFSGGGVVLFAVMAASSSDISGPPTMRAALPKANPSAYVGTSTGLGTPVAILSIPLWMVLAEYWIGL